MPPAWRRGWGCRRHRSPICWRWWATRPTASRGWPGGAPRRPAACYRVGGTPRASPATRAPWARARRPPLFRRTAPPEARAPVSDSVDDLRWVGPPDPAAFEELCERLDARRLRDRMGHVTPRVDSPSACVSDTRVVA